jgi:hypothetical protein
MNVADIEKLLVDVAELKGAGWLRSDPEAQAIARVKEIRTLLGGEPDLFAPPPAAPEGVPHLEYQRLLDEMVGATTRAVLISQKRSEEGDVAGCWLSMRLWVDARRAAEEKQHDDRKSA